MYRLKLKCHSRGTSEDRILLRKNYGKVNIILLFFFFTLYHTFSNASIDTARRENKIKNKKKILLKHQQKLINRGDIFIEIFRKRTKKNYFLLISQ